MIPADAKAWRERCERQEAARKRTLTLDRLTRAILAGQKRPVPMSNDAMPF